ncbi:MAG: Rps23 Pro-64 3,4-dihydroxylase Tpa1-like proline 4-hydroxylase [Patescibacteria group bacterium]|jgi:Rps23 Pro-64 3,4-dihydroxylase Tpa1-like proline 4-hydroxylase
MTGFVEWVNREIFTENSMNSVKKSYKKSEPFNHVVIEDFLTDELAKKLLAVIMKEKFIPKESDLFSMSQTDDLHFSSDEFVKKFNTDFLDWNFFAFISEITGIEFKGTLSMAASKYSYTDRLLCHDDRLEGRKIAYILYLSEEFSTKDGGGFLMYDTREKGEAGSIAKKILPKFNSLLFFEVTEKSFHAVEENFSQKDRFAIGGWLV